jgi:hypothetical protein
MPKNPLFSTYRQGENRVTSSMLAVFERIDLSVLESLLAAASGEAGALQMVTFINQPVGTGESIPDARIAAAFTYWFEVKTARNALHSGHKQLGDHLKILKDSARDERLFVVTPDPSRPPDVDALNDRRVVWFNFQALSDAIDESLADERGLIAEQSRFLLRELQSLLVEDGLLDSDDVVVVAARFAYPEYLQHRVYVCQPNRSFRDGLTHLGFYAESAIQAMVPRILRRVASIAFTTQEVTRLRSGDHLDSLIADAIETLLANGSRPEGGEHGVFLLSGPDDPETILLEALIINDTTTASGNPWAWTMGQRYVSLARLTSPGVKATSDLQVT